MRPATNRLRFWEFVDSSSGPGSCWPWKKARDEQGYGRFYDRADEHRAHRVALELHLGRPVTSEAVLHACDNPPCCNPAHLSEGSRGDNNADKIAKGRDARARKITEDQADEIRRACAGGASRGLYSQLARRLGISSRQVSYVAKGQRRRAVSAAIGGIAIAALVVLFDYVALAALAGGAP